MPIIESVWTIVLSLIMYSIVSLIKPYVAKFPTIHSILRFSELVLIMLFIFGIVEINIGQMIHNHVIIRKILLLFCVQLICLSVILLLLWRYKSYGEVKNDGSIDFVVINYWNSFKVILLATSVTVFVLSVLMVIIL